MAFNREPGRPPDHRASVSKAAGNLLNMPVSAAADASDQPMTITPLMFVPGSSAGGHQHHMPFAAGGSSSWGIASQPGDCRGSLYLGHGNHSSRGDQAAPGGTAYYNEYGMQKHQVAAHAPIPPLHEHNTGHAIQMLPPRMEDDHYLQLQSRPQYLSHMEEPGSFAFLQLQGDHGKPEEQRANYNRMADLCSTSIKVARDHSATQVVQEEGEELEEEEEVEQRTAMDDMKESQIRRQYIDDEMQLEEAQTASGGYGSELGLAAVSMSNAGAGSSSNMMMMKKRRLTNEQVRSLEVSFERESKLEPERKNELAQELGLQPRQVAVWFQNRRARSKTKQLERDFDLLKLQYHAVRSEKEKLQAQVARLKNLLDAQMSGSKGSTPTTSSEKEPIDADTSTQSQSIHKKTPKASSERTRALTTMRDAIEEKQDATSLGMLQKAKVFLGNSSQSAYVHALESSKSSNKGPITLEVKPSLQVPHINHQQPLHQLQQQQQHFPHILSPPTKLSLCSPQQLLLHDMVAMKMEEGNLHTSQHHEPLYNVYNEEQQQKFHHLNKSDDENYRHDSMISFHSGWHQDS